MRKYASTIILGVVLFFLSAVSLFVGVTDIDIGTLLRGGDAMELKIFFLARVPRLLAILCTGVGMSVAGLIMQQLCMNKFVSPSTGATIQSAQFGILLSLVFIPTVGLWGRVLLAFAMAISQHVFSYAVPISTFITIGGGIYFLYLLLFKKGGI